MGRAAPHSRGSVASRKRDNKTSAPVGAPPTPLRGGREWKRQTRAQQRAAGTNNTALFDIVNTDDGQRFASRAATSHASCPGRAKRDPGPRGFTAQLTDIETPRVSPLDPGSRSARASALAALARDTRPTHVARSTRVSSWFETRLAALLTMRRKRAQACAALRKKARERAFERFAVSRRRTRTCGSPRTETRSAVQPRRSSSRAGLRWPRRCLRRRGHGSRA